LRMKLVRGRVFDRTDRTDTRPVVVVSQSFAAKYWAGQDPIGKRCDVPRARILRGST
jgi:hypothetical protein